MKILNKKEFYELPEGTIYSDYEPCIFTTLKVKGSTIYNEGVPSDFLFENMIGNVKANNSDDFYNTLEFSEENKTSFELDFYCSERDGLFEDKQLFAVYEKKDLESFIKKLVRIYDLYQYKPIVV